MHDARDRRVAHEETHDHEETGHAHAQAVEHPRELIDDHHGPVVLGGDDDPVHLNGLRDLLLGSLELGASLLVLSARIFEFVAFFVDRALGALELFLAARQLGLAARYLPFGLGDLGLVLGALFLVGARYRIERAFEVVHLGLQAVGFGLQALHGLVGNAYGVGEPFVLIGDRLDVIVERCRVDGRDIEESVDILLSEVVELAAVLGDGGMRGIDAGVVVVADLFELLIVFFLRDRACGQLVVEFLLLGCELFVVGVHRIDRRLSDARLLFKGLDLGDLCVEA